MRWPLLLIILLLVPAVRADEKDAIVAKQKTFATETLKKCGVAAPALVETQDLIVCGPLAEEKLKTASELIQKQFAAAFKALKFEMTDNPPVGKIAVYFLPERKQYATFVGEVVNDRLEKDERCHIDARSKQPYLVVSVLPGEKPTDLDAEAANQVCVALLQAKAGPSSLPAWIQDGFARAMKLRQTSVKSTADRTWLKANLTRNSRYRVADIWGAVSDKEKQLLSASLMEFFVFGPGSAKLSKFLAGFRVPEDETKPSVESAITGADFTMDSLDASWKKWVQTGK